MTHTSKHRAVTAPSAAPSSLSALLSYAYVLLVFCVVVYFVERIGSQLPSVVPASAPLSTFSEERALRVTEHLVDKIGIRYVGSKQNDVDAVEFLVRTLESIQPIEGGPIMEISVQKATGSFNMKWLKKHITSMFTNVPNVVVRLRPPSNEKERSQQRRVSVERIETTEKDTHDSILSDVDVGFRELNSSHRQSSSSSSPSVEERNALLVSAHFDTSIGALGAFDDSVPIGVMSELVRNLANSPALPSPIIFNFNGGEEPGMQAAYGFISQHPWARTVRASLNLEAGGVGGRDSIVQSGPNNGWLIDAYARSVPRPFADACTRDFFSVVPADTDWIVYKDFGNAPGIDCAFTRDSALYHTRYDDMNHVRKWSGSAQHMGDNSLAFIREISQNWLSKPKVMNKLDVEDDRYFFDILGKVMIIYPRAVGDRAALTYFIVILVSIVLRYRQLNSKLKIMPTPMQFCAGIALFCVGFVASLGVGVIFSILTSLLVRYVLHVRFIWLNMHTLAFLMYGTPCWIGAMLVQSLLRRSMPSHWILAECSSWAYHIVISIATLVCLMAGFFTSHALLFATAIPFICKSAFDSLRSVFPKFGTARTILATLKLNTTLLAMFIFGAYKMVHLTQVFIPMMTRAGAEVELEIVVSIFCGVMSFLFLSPVFLSGMAQRLGRFSVVIKALVALHVCTLVFIVLAATGINNSPSILHPLSPALSIPAFTTETPKRIYVHQAFDLDESNRIRKDTMFLATADSVQVDEILDLQPEMRHVRRSPREELDLTSQTLYPYGSMLQGVVLWEHKYDSVSERPEPVAKPELQLLRDTIEQIDGTTFSRKMRFYFHTGGDACWANLEIRDDTSAGHVHRWSLTKSGMPPYSDPAKRIYNVRKLGFGGHEFELELRLKNNSSSTVKMQSSPSESTEQLRTRLGFGPFRVYMTNSCWAERPEEAVRIEEHMPDWTAPWAYACFMREFVF